MSAHASTHSFPRYVVTWRGGRAAWSTCPRTLFATSHRHSQGVHRAPPRADMDTTLVHDTQPRGRRLEPCTTRAGWLRMGTHAGGQGCQIFHHAARTLCPPAVTTHGYPHTAPCGSCSVTSHRHTFARSVACGVKRARGGGRSHGTGVPHGVSSFPNMPVGPHTAHTRATGAARHTNTSHRVRSPYFARCRLVCARAHEATMWWSGWLARASQELNTSVHTPPSWFNPPT